MPKVPQPTKTPASISPALWQNDNREEILSFLGNHGGAYLFYEVMQNDPDHKSSKVDKDNAVKVDTITNLQKAQFLAQADSMHLDEKTKTPVKKKKEEGDEEEIEKAFEGGEGGAINFQKIFAVVLSTYLLTPMPSSVVDTPLGLAVCLRECIVHDDFRHDDFRPHS